MPSLVRVINPNSNRQMTASFSAALDGLRLSDGPEIDCVTLPDGPFGIETDAHVETAAGLVADYVANDSAAGAFVIGCYSDPGLVDARMHTDRPIFGMAECAIAAALVHGNRFGIISISDQSVVRHASQMEALDLHHRCAGDRPLNISVTDAEAGADTLLRMIDVGKALRDEDGADILIMACAGFSKHRQPLRDALGVEVIDPILAGTVQAIGAVQAVRQA